MKSKVRNIVGVDLQGLFAGCIRFCESQNLGYFLQNLKMQNLGYFLQNLKMQNLGFSQNLAQIHTLDSAPNPH